MMATPTYLTCRGGLRFPCDSAKDVVLFTYLPCHIRCFTENIGLSRGLNQVDSAALFRNRRFLTPRSLRSLGGFLHGEILPHFPDPLLGGRYFLLKYELSSFVQKIPAAGFF